MKPLARAFWLAVQTAHLLPVLLWLCLRRRGVPLVLTHWHDRDAHGRDGQTGPLLAALGKRIEVARVPRTRATLTRLREPVVFLAPLLALARVLAPRGGRMRIARARARVVRWLLAALRPRAVLLIDESGSGQPFVHAARALGIRSAGIQHGDFLPGDPLYDGRLARDVVPADVLCVWSSWFRARLLSISAAYDEGRVRVTGRMRFPPPTEVPRDPRRLRVLVLGEAGDEFAAAVEPFLSALARDPDVEVAVQPHPARAQATRDLASALAWCDVALGMRSSALYEALFHRRPVVVACKERAHPLAGLVAFCPEPEHAAHACRQAAADPATLARARAVVWGDPPDDPVREVLAAVGIGDGPAPSAGSVPAPRGSRAATGVTRTR